MQGRFCRWVSRIPPTRTLSCNHDKDNGEFSRWVIRIMIRIRIRVSRIPPTRTLSCNKNEEDNGEYEHCMAVKLFSVNEEHTPTIIVMEFGIAPVWTKINAVYDFQDNAQPRL